MSQRAKVKCAKDILMWSADVQICCGMALMRYDETLAINDDTNNSGNTAGLESTYSKGATPNVGTGPAPSIPDGGKEGEAKQPKEHTGKDTDMGGATGGTSGLPDASEGNDNTSRE